MHCHFCGCEPVRCSACGKKVEVLQMQGASNDEAPRRDSATSLLSTLKCLFCGERLVVGGRFCAYCGRKQELKDETSFAEPHNQTAMSSPDTTQDYLVVTVPSHEDLTEPVPSQEELIEQYFHAGHSYKDIVDLLSAEHDICVSLRTVKSRLSSLGLFRRKYYSRSEDIRKAVVQELQVHGQLLGYRTMWQVLKHKYGLHAKRSDVMRLLSETKGRSTPQA
ncbi:hypothetical protein AGOR_G00033470 [Albula goreensis]|uniref:Uncharacterized protein n=1 Tax=Albula goreensis TaxID=1534307 RepID=A0A8T3DWP3_9TELE|nr:hypothetical protein AGOR_G00033470 [Albula goreensis]